MQIKIYALINPINDSVFYVGATFSELYVRLSGHLSSKGANNKKEIIINQIKFLGKRPEMLLLEEVQHTEAGFYEQFYMDLFKSFGFKLTNKYKANYSEVYNGWAELRDELCGQ